MQQLKKLVRITLKSIKQNWMRWMLVKKITENIRQNLSFVKIRQTTAAAGMIWQKK